MKKLATLVVFAVSMMISVSAFAVGHNGNAGHAALMMDKWATMCKQGNTVTPVTEAGRIYYEGDMKMAYYDNWVVLDKADQRNFKRLGMSTVGLPDAFLDVTNKGNN